jgi:hydroxymethylglutaryl-CoA synthase
MIGISKYSYLLPTFRLPLQQMDEFFGSKGRKGWKYVASFDEDSVTLATESAKRLLGPEGEKGIDALFFASTTVPYSEGLHANILVKALQQSPHIQTADFAHSLKSSTAALYTAFQIVRGENDKKVLVTASDCRVGKINSLEEKEFSDGAVSFLMEFGEGVAVELLHTYQLQDRDFFQWRKGNHVYVQRWEERFGQYVSSQLVQQAVAEFEQQTNMSLHHANHIIVSAPTLKLQQQLEKQLRIPKQQLMYKENLVLGHFGSANGPLLFSLALEQAKKGETIIWIQVGDGCDIFAFEVHKEITPNGMNRTVLQDERYFKEVSYGQFLKWRELILVDKGRRPDAPIPSAPALKRNEEKVYSLIGSKCQTCGQVSYPKQRICSHCFSKDKIEPYSFYGKDGTIRTYTIDYLASSPSQPTVFAVVDIDGGGRMLLQLTDCDPHEVEIGRKVTFTFRRLYEAGGIINYYWKGTLKRGDRVEKIDT